MTIRRAPGWKTYLIGLGATAGAVTSIFVFFDHFDFKVDRPAWASELKEIKELSIGTRQIILSDKWFQTKEKLEDITNQLRMNPSDPLLRQIKSQHERQLDNIERQQQELERLIEE